MTLPMRLFRRRRQLRKIEKLAAALAALSRG